MALIESVSSTLKEFQQQAPQTSAKGSGFADYLKASEEASAPYQWLAVDNTIVYKGVTFVCDPERNQLCLGDVSDSRKCLHIPLAGGGTLVVNRENLNELTQAITMFSPEDINNILRAIAADKRAQEMQYELEDMEGSIGDLLVET